MASEAVLYTRLTNLKNKENGNLDISLVVVIGYSTPTISWIAEVASVVAPTRTPLYLRCRISVGSTIFLVIWDDSTKTLNEASKH